MLCRDAWHRNRPAEFRGPDPTNVSRKRAYCETVFDPVCDGSDGSAGRIGRLCPVAMGFVPGRELQYKLSPNVTDRRRNKRGHNLPLVHPASIRCFDCRNGLQLVSRVDCLVPDSRRNNIQRQHVHLALWDDLLFPVPDDVDFAVDGEIDGI